MLLGDKTPPMGERTFDHYVWELEALRAVIQESKLQLHKQGKVVKLNTDGWEKYED